MQSLPVQRWGAFVIAVCLLTASMVQPAVAAIISTETAIELEHRQTRVDHISDVLAQENVRSMLVRMGVDPVYANTRVAALTDEELEALQQNLDQIPAGGVGFVEVVGIVAIVLIVLELLHVTNFFNEF